MKNIRKLLIGLGLLLLSGNAAAIMIGGTVDAVYKKMDLSMEEIAVLLRDYQAESKKQVKYLKKANKKFNKLSAFLSKKTAAGLSDKKAAKLARKQVKKEQKLASILNSMDLDLTAFLASAAVPTDVQYVPVPDQEDGTQGVPEPATIALLGIGLAGFATTCRLQRQS
jgi:hypothetical protein